MDVLLSLERRKSKRILMITFIIMVIFIYKNSIKIPKEDLNRYRLPYGTRSKGKTLLVIAILSARTFTHRRNAIRETWMKKCKMYPQVVRCIFVTDYLYSNGTKIDNESLEKLKEESETHRDLVLANTPSGTNFGVRLLWTMDWATQNFEFEYLLRLDDDYFVCITQLLDDLEYRPRKKLAWGFVHCSQGFSRIDEGFLIMTRDVVEDIVRKRHRLICHPFGDQAMAYWMEDLKYNVTWLHDSRLHHDPPFSKTNLLKDENFDPCRTHIGYHGTSAEDMFRIYTKSVKYEAFQKRGLWKNWKTNNSCPRRSFDHRKFEKEWKKNISLCDDYKPDHSSDVYKGRIQGI